MTKVLLVEDDPRIARFVKRGLEAESYVVDVAARGGEALARCREIDYPLIILDRMLPDMDGLDVCRNLREAGHGACVLMLTAKDARQDKVDGLRVGADDYLTKPFAFDELLARMQALLRRGPYQAGGPAVLRVADLTLDPASRKVARANREIALTAREFALLSYLMANAGTVVSRTKLLANVWAYGFDPGTKVVDVYIRYLRRKIDADGEKPLIHTVRGFGYGIAAD
jgi:two-component system, OmpR family, response regulator